MTVRLLIAHCAIVAIASCCGANLLAAEKIAARIGSADAARFVSIGQLASTPSADGKSVQYVLLDENGNILNRLQPTEGLDLSRHLGAEVGITARSLAGGDIPLLLAESVTTFTEAREAVVEPPNATGTAARAAYQEVLPTPSVMVPTDEPILPSPAFSGEMVSPQFSGEYVDGGFAPDGYAIGACSQCGDLNCGTCAACPCGLPGQMWIRAEYLLWSTDGMNTPPLVTTSPAGTSRDDAGVLGRRGTTILFGGDELFDGSRSGGRFRIGKWCDHCQWIGFETEFLFLEDESENFWECSIGDQIFARPFFNTERQENDSELVQFPSVLVGTVHVDAETSLWSISPRFRVNLACETLGGCGGCYDCGMHGGYRFDLLLGYRYFRLEDGLRIRENLSTLSPDDQTVFELRDSFTSSNDFNGADLGLLWEGYRGPWSLELIGRVALGNNRQKVNINGSTATTNSGTTFNDPGGLLALSSNIGSYDRNKFAAIPEFGATLGYAISPRTRFTLGYSVLYWNKVVRAGDHVDLNVNPNLLPPVQPNPGDLNPRFAFDDTSFWAQGLSLGLDYRW